MLSPQITTSPNTHQFAQELLSTFSTAIGEAALIPSTGGVFKVGIECEVPATAEDEVQLGSGDGSGGTGTVNDGIKGEGKTSQRRRTTSKILWDRGVEGGFPGRFISSDFGGGIERGVVWERGPGEVV